MVTDEPSEESRLLDDARTQVHEAIDAAPARARLAADAAGRRWYRRAVLGASVVAVVVAVSVAYVALALSRDALARVDQQDVKLATLREIADQAKTQGEQANAALQARGQPPVPIPQPGHADDSEVLVAAATAQVLERLPDASPTDTELAAAIVRVAADNRELFAPSPQQIANGVAGYLALNPPPTGPTGPTGPSGSPGQDGEDGRDGQDAPPPTAEQLQAAVAAYLRDNPDALCPRGGSFAQLTVRLADGGTADAWACVVQVSPPTTTTAEPTTGPPPLLPIPRR